MPETDSAICAVTAPMRSRVSTSATCDTRVNQRVRTSAGGTVAITTRPRRQSAMSSAAIADGSRMTLETSVGIPCERTSLTASTSLVRRAMIQPAFCCEK